MKKLLMFVFFSLTLFLLFNSCNKKAETRAEGPMILDFEVFSVHDLTMKPGVNEKKFEAFVMNEIAPLYGKMKGQKLYLVKGERGIRKNLYAIFLTFTSIEDLDRIYPHDIGFSEEFKKVFEGKDSLWATFNTMAEGFDGMHNTDYIKVVH